MFNDTFLFNASCMLQNYISSPSRIQLQVWKRLQEKCKRCYQEVVLNLLVKQHHRWCLHFLFQIPSEAAVWIQDEELIVGKHQLCLTMALIFEVLGNRLQSSAPFSNEMKYSKIATAFEQLSCLCLTIYTTQFKITLWYWWDIV